MLRKASSVIWRMSLPSHRETSVFTRYQPSVRYIVYAARWVCLVHFQIQVLVPALFHDGTLNADIKMWLMTLLVAAIRPANNRFLVRNTFLGVVLNGRMCARELQCRVSPRSSAFPDGGPDQAARGSPFAGNARAETRAGSVDESRRSRLVSRSGVRSATREEGPSR